MKLLLYCTVLDFNYEPKPVMMVILVYSILSWKFHVSSTLNFLMVSIPIYCEFVLFKAVVKYVGGFWPIGVFFAGYRSFFFVPSRQTQTKARL